MSNPFGININKFADGFIIDITAITVQGIQRVEISPYELSRNNIRADLVQSVKVANFGTVEPVMLFTDNDFIQIPQLVCAVQPLSIGRGSLVVRGYFGVLDPPYSDPNTLKIVCYYKSVGHYAMTLDIY